MVTTNEVRLIGNVGNVEPIVRTENGNVILRLSLATSYESKTATGEKLQHTEWHRVNIFGKYAEALEHQIKKGSRVICFGSLHYNKYLNKKEIEVVSAEINCTNISILQRKDESKAE